MSSEKKTKAKQLQESLTLKRVNGAAKFSAEEIKEIDAFCEGYKTFLDNSKTERTCVTYTIGLLKEHGFTEFDPSKAYKAGDKVYLNNRNKSLITAVIGSADIKEGVSILASHIDSPRIDLKPNPLYEEAELSLFKTHYYGGVRKYQWTAIPLALHGVVVKANGEAVTVCIGEDESDPVFCITDLLPHLAADQAKRTLNEGIKGEELNILVGSRAFGEIEADENISNKVKLNILAILNERYGMVEKDFLSAEFEIVPAGRTRDIGLDRSLIGGYGQDDRVCAYTSLMATIECQNPKHTIVNIFGDKEEIGSEGNTGLKSRALQYFITDLAKANGVSGRLVLTNSKCLSADVSVAFDPTFPDVTEKYNVSHLNYGVCLTKYTGSRGKGGSSDASAEFMGYVRGIFEAEDVLWQTGELGKVDQGGGGTVAAYIANLNVDVVDVGVPVLSMHAPMEVTSKIDVYSTYKAFFAFCKR